MDSPADFPYNPFRRKEEDNEPGATKLPRFDCPLFGTISEYFMVKHRNRLPKDDPGDAGKPVQTKRPTSEFTLSSSAVAEIFKVETRTVANWAKSGKLEARNVGSPFKIKYRFHPDDVEELRQQSPVADDDQL